MFKMQDYPQKWTSSCNLREPSPQAEAGIAIIKNLKLKVKSYEDKYKQKQKF